MPESASESVWNRTSFVLIVPYSTRWRVRELADATAVPGDAPDWREPPPRIPLSLLYEKPDQATPANEEWPAFSLHRHWVRPRTYFSSEKIQDAATPRAYNYWLGGGEYETSSGVVTFPRHIEGLRLIGAECQEFGDLTLRCAGT